MYFDKQQLSQKIININKAPLVYKKQKPLQNILVGFFNI